MGTLMEKGQLEVANSFSVKRKREKKNKRDRHLQVGRCFLSLISFPVNTCRAKNQSISVFWKEEEDANSGRCLVKYSLLSLPFPQTLPCKQHMLSSHFQHPHINKQTKIGNMYPFTTTCLRNKEGEMITNKESVQYANLADTTKQFTFSTDIHRDTSSLHSLDVVLFAWYT